MSTTWREHFPVGAKVTIGPCTGTEPYPRWLAVGATGLISSHLEGADYPLFVRIEGRADPECFRPSELRLAPPNLIARTHREPIT